MFEYMGNAFGVGWNGTKAYEEDVLIVFAREMVVRSAGDTMHIVLHGQIQ